MHDYTNIRSLNTEKKCLVVLLKQTSNQSKQLNVFSHVAVVKMTQRENKEERDLK